MSPKAKVLLSVGVGCLVIAAAVVAAFWFFGASQETVANQKPQTSAETSTKEAKPPEAVAPLTLEVADRLTAEMLSSDPAVYQNVWAQPVQMPMPPQGTSLAIHKETLEFHEVAGHAKATLVMPGKGSSEVDVWYQYVGNEWKIRGIQ